MICIRKPGDYFRVGLNLCFARDHVAVHWAWYDFARREGSHKGFRRRSARWNVVDEYARSHNLEMVNREVLADLKETESGQMKRMDEFSYLHRLDTSRPL